MIDTHRCWHWPGAHFARTGRARLNGNNATRAIWEMAHDEMLPEGYDAHHTCGRVWCVNPWHLVAEAESVHGRRHALTMPRKRKVTCAHGHDMTDADNVRQYVRPDGRVEHVCRQCSRDRKRAARITLRV